MNKNQQYVVQSHTKLASAMRGMARAIWNKGKLATDLEKEHAAHFWAEASQHEWLAYVVGDTFVSIR